MKMMVVGMTLILKLVRLIMEIVFVMVLMFGWGQCILLEEKVCLNENSSYSVPNIFCDSIYWVSS